MTREVEPRQPYSRQPYRGQPEPRYVKTGRRFRNLLAEKRERFRILLILGLLNITAVVGLIFFYTAGNEILFALFFVGTIFLFVFTVTAESGTREIDKFQPGYDIDISNEKDHEHNEDGN